MKRTWYAYVAIVAAIVFGTIVSTASAENKRGNNSLGGKKVFSQGSQNSTRSLTPSFKPKLVLGNGSNSGNSNGNNSGNNLPRVTQFKPQIIKGLGQVNPGTTLNPRLGGSLGIGNGNGGIVHKIPGLADKIGKPNIPILDPGIGNGQPGGQQPGGNGNGKPGKGNGWFPPIIIGCGPNNGGYYPTFPCYPVGNCYPIYQTQPIIVQRPVVVASAPVVVTEVKAAEKLLQVPVGSTISLQANDLGDNPGQVLLVLEKLTLATQMNEWKPDHVNVTLPLMGIGEPTKAELAIVKPDGQIANSVKIELIPALAPTGNPAPTTAVVR